MPQNANSVRATHHRQLRLVPEVTPGVLDTGAAPILCDDLNAPFTAKIVSGRKEHTPQGANGSAYVGRHRMHVEVSGLSADPDYNAIKKWLDGIYTRHSKTTSGGKDKYVWRKKPYGMGAVQSYSANYGLPDDSDTATSFFIGEMEIGSGRKNEPALSLSGFARRPTKGGLLIGATARNAILNIVGANVSTSGVFALKIGNAVPVNVTFAVGDTTAQTVAKLLAAGLTAAVVGTVALGDGEKHTIVGTGNTFTIYTDILVDTAVDTLATIQAKIRAKAGRASAVVSGSISKPTPGNLLTGSTPTVTPNSGSVANAIDGSLSTSATLGNVADGGPSGFVLVFDRGAGAVNTEVSGLKIDNGAGGFDSGADSYAETSADGTTWTPLTGAIQIFYNQSYTYAIAPGTVAKRYVRLTTTHNQGAYTQWQVKEITLIPANIVPGAANLQVQYDSAAGNVADVEAVPGPGYVGQSTQPGAGGGAMQITATAPANTPVSLTWVSGAGWSSSLQQAGSNGVVVPLPVSPITSSDWLIRRATTYGDLTSPDPLEVVDAAYDYSLKIEDIFAPHWTATGTETFDRVKCGKRLHTATIALDDANTGHLPQIEAGADDSAKRISVPDWYEFGHRAGDGLSFLAWRLCMAVVDDFEPQDEEDVEGKSMSLTEISVGTGEDFCVEVVLEVPAGTFAD